MNKINKKSISLIEIIFILIISSLLFLSISNITLDLNKNNTIEYKKNILKIEFETTRLFLEKKLPIDLKLDKLDYRNNTIYYNNNILLKNVISYSKVIINDKITVSICLKNKIKMCQDIRIQNDI